MKTWKSGKQDGDKGIFLGTVDREEHEMPESAFGADVDLDSDGQAQSVVLAEKRFLPFTKPGARVATKRLYTVKAEKPDGTVIQVPLENQINNNVAAPDMFVGLQHYTRRGTNVFFDLETGKGAFCPTWDCWAEWNDKLNGFCCDAHMQITKPTKQAGAFDEGATTSSIWG